MPFLTLSKRNRFAVMFAGLATIAWQQCAVALPLPVSGTLNQVNTAIGINTAVSNGASPSGGFATLSTLSGSALTNALDQLSGSVSVDLGASAALGGNPLLNLVGGTSANGGIDLGTGLSVTSLPPTLGTLPWASGLGGHSDITGNAATGAQGISSGTIGIAAGLEHRFNSATVLGGSIAYDHESLSAGSGGSAHSNDVTIAGYVRQPVLDRGYLAAALSYGWHDIVTNRIVTVSGTDNLQANFTANDLSGRIEAGYRVSLSDEVVMAPFIAFVADSFSAPAYSERAVSGASTFALAYSAATTDTDHLELGAHIGHDYKLVDGVLNLSGNAAWAHQVSGSPVARVAFQSLPGSSFLVNGLTPVKDAALLGAGLEMQANERFSYGVRADALIGSGTSAVSGMLNLTYRW